MSDTAEKIDGMTDAGAFETLALRVLREIDEDCRAIIHLGINAVGKPIPGPVDGFGRVPDSSPSKYVTAAFTTMNPSGLEQKWLGSRRASGLLQSSRIGPARGQEYPPDLRWESAATDQNQEAGVSGGSACFVATLLAALTA